MSTLTGCSGFQPHRFRPEKCLNCFLPKAVHSKRTPPAVSPRPGRKSIPDLNASGNHPHLSVPGLSPMSPNAPSLSPVFPVAAATVAPTAAAPAAAVAPVAAVSATVVPEAVQSTPPAGAPKLLVLRTFKHVPKQTPVADPVAPAPASAPAPAPVPTPAAAAAVPAIVEPEDSSLSLAGFAAPSPTAGLHMNTMALTEHFKRRESGFSMSTTGTLSAADHSEIGEITNEVMTNYEDNYTIGALLGEGGYGQVYQAVPKRGMNRDPVAIKVLPKNKLVDQQSRDELRGEISIMHLVAGHHDNNFLRIMGVYETRTKIAIVSEMCQGDMIKLIEKCTTERMAAHLFAEVISSVAALHSMGIIHRDLKPENFLVGMDGKLRLCDFGLAVPATDLGLRGSFKEPGQAKGTLFFVPPEAFRNEFSVASDIWACGVILHVLLTGFHPYKTVEQIASPAPFDTYTLKSMGTSTDAQDLLKRLLAKDPTQRPLAAEVLRDAWLRKYCATGSIVTEDVILSRLASYGKLDKVKRGLMKVVGMNLQPSEIANVGRWFMQMDKDGSQSLTLDELKEAFMKRGIPAAKIEEVMKMVDINGDERIDYDEFITAAMSQNLLQREETLRAAFRKLDINGDGKLSRQELIGGFKGTHTTGFTEAEIDTFLQRYDKDQSNSIDYDEFVDMMSIA